MTDSRVDFLTALSRANATLIRGPLAETLTEQERLFARTREETINAWMVKETRRQFGANP